MAELWFDDLASADAAFASPAGQAAHADADAHVARRERLNLREHTIIDHPAPPRFKYTAGLKRRAAMNREAFAHWWLERHVPYVKQFPALRKYRVSLVESGPETVVDGLAEVWFDDIVTLRRVTASEVVKEAQQHSLPTPVTESASPWRSITSVSFQEVFAIFMDKRAAASQVHGSWTRPGRV
jgi:uncharacterized protein (TIGR02118 family)